MNADHKQGCPGRSAFRQDRREFLKAAAAVSAAIYQAVSSQAFADEGNTKQVLIVVGPSKHPPGTHEVAAGGRVMKYVLEHAEGVPPIAAEVVYKWPEEKNVLDRAATIVFIGDLFPGETLDNPAKVKADLARVMGNGCGMVCVHYATGLQAKHVTDDGDHPLLGWIGGYFATGCKHHRSVAQSARQRSCRKRQTILCFAGGRRSASLTSRTGTTTSARRARRRTSRRW